MIPLLFAGLGLLVSLAVRWDRAWQRHRPTRLVLPVWDGLPAEDRRALPMLDVWDPELGA